MLRWALKNLMYIYLLVFNYTSIYASFYPIKTIISNSHNVSDILANYVQKNRADLYITAYQASYTQYKTFSASTILKTASLSVKEFINIAQNIDKSLVYENNETNINNQKVIYESIATLSNSYTTKLTSAPLVTPKLDSSNKNLEISIPSSIMDNKNSSVHINVFQDDSQELKDQSLQDDKASKLSIYRDKISEPEYVSIKLQIIDERSIIEQNLIYPIANANIHLIGLGYKTVSDYRGRVILNELPINSRFFVFVESSTLEFLPTIVEISTMLSSLDHIQYIKVLRYSTYNIYQELVKTAQHLAKSSFCGRLVGAELKDYQIKLDVPSSRVFYFNRFNILDTLLSQTSENGKFCIFNIEPGPAAINILKDNELIHSMPINFFPSRHVEKDMNINSNNTDQIMCSIAFHPSAPETLNYLESHKDPYIVINDLHNIEVSGIGLYNPFVPDTVKGVFKSDKEVFKSDGKMYLTIEAPEFEFAFYQLEEDAPANKALIAIPRGFVQDMALYANVSYISEQGSLIIDHHNFEGQESEGVNIKVINYDGKEVDNGWYFGEYPTTKAIYFNLEPGQYQIIIHDKNGNLLSSQTTFIYNETLSIIQTGKQLLYKLN